MNHSVIDQTGITTTREFLRRHAPFDLMSPAHVEFLAKRLRLAFYARGEAITSPEQATAVDDGRLHGASARGRQDQDLVLRLQEGL